MRSILLTSSTAVAVMLAATAGAAAAEHVVEIVDYTFRPQTVRIKTGDVVRWVNGERRTSHSVVFNTGSVPESPRLFPGESWERRFEQPGAYSYTCGPHPEMAGIVEVTDQ